MLTTLFKKEGKSLFDERWTINQSVYILRMYSRQKKLYKKIGPK